MGYDMHVEDGPDEAERTAIEESDSKIHHLRRSDRFR